MKQKKSILRKVEVIAKDIMHFQNMLKIFLNRLYNIDPQAFYAIINLPYMLESLVRKKVIPLPAIQNDQQLMDLLDQMYDMFKSKLGFGLTIESTRLVRESYISALKLRANGRKASFPKPKKLNSVSRFTFRIRSDNFRLKDNKTLTIRLGQKSTNHQKIIKLKVSDCIESIRCINITVIFGIAVFFNIVYKTDIVNQAFNIDTSKFISVDLGYTNLLSMVSNTVESIVINGKPLKHFYVWVRDKLAEFQSKNDWIAYRKLLVYLKNVNKVLYHTIPNFIIQLCLKYNIGKIYVGDIMNIFQQTSNLSSRFNKSFRLFKFGYLVNLLKYKGEPYGIKVEVISEEYTSTYDPFTNKKVVRKKSLAKGSYGTYHADLMGALNIAKKAMNKCFCVTNRLNTINQIHALF
jgi:IS605 OrfB family transposase